MSERRFVPFAFFFLTGVAAIPLTLPEFVFLARILNTVGEGVGGQAASDGTENG